MHQNDFNFEVYSREDFENSSWCVVYIFFPVWKIELKFMKFDIVLNRYER